MWCPRESRKSPPPQRCRSGSAHVVPAGRPCQPDWLCDAVTQPVGPAGASRHARDGAMLPTRARHTRAWELIALGRAAAALSQAHAQSGGQLGGKRLPAPSRQEAGGDR